MQKPDCSGSLLSVWRVAAPPGTGIKIGAGRRRHLRPGQYGNENAKHNEDKDEE
jgi:hypothetical protein